MTEDDRKWLEAFDATEKKQTSYTGGFLFTEPANPEPKDTRLKFDLEKISLLGGDWLEMLYLNNSNIEITASQLGMKQNTLRKKLLRLREKLIAEGYNHNNLYKKLKKS
jgi:hypothetical protein